jgi:hypothetical protein
MTQIIMILYSNRIGGESMNINDTINLMKKINKQNNAYIKGNDYNANSMVSSPDPVSNSTREISAYDELIKEALYNNFIKVADKLRLDQKAKNTGANFIQSVIDKSTDEVNKAHYKTLNPSNEESVIEYTYASIVEDYARELRSVNYELNGIQGIREDSTTLAHEGIIDRFNDSITKFTPSKINDTIADRVEKATTNFIDDRNAKIEQIKDIYQKAKSFAANPKFSDEAKQRVEESASRQVLEIRKSQKSIFESMVEALTSAAMVNPNLQSRYMDESSGLNMDAIIDDTAAIYTVLEECNVFGFLDANKLADAYIASLKQK